MIIVWSNAVVLLVGVYFMFYFEILEFHGLKMQLLFIFSYVLFLDTSLIFIHLNLITSFAENMEC